MALAGGTDDGAALTAQYELLDLPAARLAAMLFHHADIGHHHAAVDGLAHSVDGRQADLHK